MRKLLVLALTMTLFACGPTDETRVTTEDVPTEQVEVSEDASGPMITSQSQDTTVVSDTTTSVDPNEEREAREGIRFDIANSGLNMRGTFQVPGEGIPFCAAAIDEFGTGVANVDVRVTDVLGNPVEMTDKFDGVRFVPGPDGDTNADGFFYFEVVGEEEGWYFVEVRLDGYDLGIPPRGINFTESAEELNAPYPLANTPFPQGKCLEAATLDELNE